MPLQRETVARAALRLLNEVGLDNLTMRRLATDLDIQNPSLYWHFKNKQELLNCMAGLMIAEAFTELQPPASSQDWADWLAQWARRLRKTMLAYRDGARVVAEANLLLNDFFEVIELALNILQQAGFDESKAASGVMMVTHYVMGSAFELQADPSFFAYKRVRKALVPVSIKNVFPGLWPSFTAQKFSHPPLLIYGLKRGCPWFSMDYGPTWQKNIQARGAPLDKLAVLVYIGPVNLALLD